MPLLEPLALQRKFFPDQQNGAQVVLIEAEHDFF
jgi:hypothetical protein